MAKFFSPMLVKDFPFNKGIATAMYTEFDKKLCFFTTGGSKRNIMPVITKHFPDKVDALCEPFFGTGASLLYNIEKYHPKFVVAGDINKLTIDAVNELKKNPEWHQNFFEQLKTYYLTLDNNDRREMFYELRDLYNDKKVQEPYKSSIYFFLSTVAFPARSVLVDKTKCGFSYCTAANTSFPNVINLCSILGDTVLIHGDYNQTIQKFIRECPKEYVKNSLIYCDPPYATPDSARFYGYNTKRKAKDDRYFGLSKHAEMWNKLNIYVDLGFRNIIVSGYDDETTKRTYFNAEFLVFDTNKTNVGRITAKGKHQSRTKESIYFVPYLHDKL